MTSIMSYQYPPPPPPNGTEMDIPPPGYMSNYGVPQPAASPMDMRSGQEPPISLKDRKDSLSQASRKIKLSLSTPNIRAQQHSPDHGSMGMSSSDKRRNKLGYHRTSVACGKSAWTCPPPVGGPVSAALLRDTIQVTVDGERSGASLPLPMSRGDA